MSISTVYKIISYKTFSEELDNYIISKLNLMVHSERSVFYFVNGKLHRENGPARIWSGDSLCYEYYFLGKRHRLGGPALRYKQFNVYNDHYYIQGFEVTKEKHDFLHSVYLNSEEEYKDILKLEGII